MPGSYAWQILKGFHFNKNFLYGIRVKKILFILLTVILVVSSGVQIQAAKVDYEVSAFRCKNLKKVKVSAILLLKGGISND